MTQANDDRVRGRRFQDEVFVVDDFPGRRLERLLADDNDGSWILFLKPERKHWQRFFTDAGLGFWEEWSDSDIADELSERPTVDLGVRFGVVGAGIVAARCSPGPRIELRLSMGTVILEPSDPNEFDGDSIVRFVPLSDE